MREAVIVAACRTAVGKAPRGALKYTRPEEMGSVVLRELLKRASDLDPMLIDDVIMGCAFPEFTQGMNIGRVLVLAAGWPDRIPGMTVNRFCSSGLEAIVLGAHQIMSGQSNVIIAGGIESMSQVPLGGNLAYPNPAMVVWLGPILGCLIPLVLWLLVPRRMTSARNVASFFAGFCLISNGSYIAIGSLDRVGDCGEMLRTGSPLWTLFAFGVVTVALGLFLWHRLGSLKHFLSNPSVIASRSAYLVLSVLLAVIVAGIMLSPR